MKRNLLKTFGIALAFVSTVGVSSCSSSKVTNDRLVIGMECNYQPFNWTAKESSEFTLPIYKTNEFADGYDIQVAKFLSEETGKEVEIHRLTWDALIPEVQNGGINMVLAGMSVTTDRLEQIDFTNPYLKSDLAFLVNKSAIPAGNSKENPATYEELLDLFDGKTLVCQSAVVGDTIIEDYFTNNDKGKTIRHADPLATYPLAAQDILSGNSFAMPAELPVVEAMVNLDSSKLGVLYVDYSFLSDTDLLGLSVNIGVKKGNDELKNELNEALAKLSDSKRSELMGAASTRSGDNA